MNCGYCGSSVNGNAYTQDPKTNKKIHFCDKHCICVYHRERERPIIEQHLKRYTEMYEEVEEIELKRLIKIKLLLLNSFLLRKPRAELKKLVELSQRICAEIIEYGHEQKDDLITFEYGEIFKKTYTSSIEIWCS